MASVERTANMPERRVGLDHQAGGDRRRTLSRSRLLARRSSRDIVALAMLPVGALLSGVIAVAAPAVPATTPAAANTQPSPATRPATRPAAAAGMSPAEVTRLIAQLDHPNPKVRE